MEQRRMNSQTLRRIGLIGILALALALAGCGNSKKGGGSSYYTPIHAGSLSSGHLQGG